jgi:cell division protein FtsI/penicillin-binding protein 2
MRSSVWLVTLVALCLAGGAGRLAYIEVARGPELRLRAAHQQRAVRTIGARRGEILDTRGRVLAGTVRRPSLFVDPGLVRDLRFAAYSLAPVLKRDPGGFERELEKWRGDGVRFMWLKRDVADAELEEFKSVVDARRLSGFEIQQEALRLYPQGRLAAHVLGFVSTDLRKPDQGEPFEDLVGREGLEGACDGLLHGTPGRQTVVVDVGRRAVRAPAEAYQPAVDGATLVLTIDTYIQQATEKALGAAVSKFGAEWGASVVIDPQTGEVLAMAVAPDFDPAEPYPPNFHELSEAQQATAMERWRNRAVADCFEPGSVFKPYVASCALDEGIVRIDEVFTINGPVRDFGVRTIHDTHPYGSLALHEVISKSSNIGMGMVGGRCGMARLNRFVRSFGFGDITGVGLPGEHTGLVQEFSKWNPLFSPQSIPIGQEIAVTPIQIVTAFSVFCNGGLLYRPRIVRGVIGADGTTVVDNSQPIAVRRVLDERTSEQFRKEALVETVTAGTGKSAKLDEYQVFGKTGTAQISRGGGHAYEAKYVGSFVGGAPSDHPRVVALVSIYKPSKEGYYGGTVAAPAVREILAEALAYMQVPPELTPAPEPAHGAKRGSGREGGRSAGSGQRSEDHGGD